MITIKNSQIRLIGYSLLLISIILFIFTWLQWYVSIPAICLLIYAFIKVSRNVKDDQRVFCISKGTILLILIIVIAWVLLSGVGGAFPQKNDMHWRNAILHDLINYPWPVRYSDGFDSSLTYYIAFWMIPALVGKLFAVFVGAQAGWIAANIISAIYCASIIFVVILLLISHLNAYSRNRVLLIAAILVLFSGMDIIPTVLAQAEQDNFDIGTHIEWWSYIQYSSNTTQLSWVFNQAIPTWLVVSLLFHERKMHHFAFLGLLLFPFAPLPFVGVCFLMVTEAFIRIMPAIKNKQVGKLCIEILSAPNIIAIAVVFPIYFFYYHSNATASGNGAGWNSFHLVSYNAFVIFEFLIILVLIWRHNYKKPYFVTSSFGLFLIPLFTFGSGQDFCMRVSIPLLFVIMVYTMDYILQNIYRFENKKLRVHKKAIPVIIILIIGAATPLSEYRESYLQIVQSDSHCTSIYADRFGTLDNGEMERDNFITKNASDTFFYRYLAKGEK